MSDRDHSLEDDPLANEFELDVEEEGDLESAVREALEAVERSDSGAGVAVDDAAGDAQEAAANRPAAAAPIAGDDLSELRDRYVRVLADFDNYRKRTEREQRDSRRYEGLELLREVLPVVDNLERAVGSEGSVEDLRTGVRMILRQVEDLLQRSGVVRVPALGEPFDPNVHEAVQREEDAAVDVPTVSQEMQTGYLLRDRLLRPAIVKVAMPTGPGEESE